MVGLTLDTPDSVIEWIWDIALAVLIVRVAFIYFLINFTFGLLLSAILYAALSPNVFPGTSPSYASISLYTILVFVSAKFTVSHYEIPRSLRIRFAIGGVAALLTAIVYSLVLIIVYESRQWDWLVGMEGQACLMFSSTLVAIGVMPAIMVDIKRWPVIKLEQRMHQSLEKPSLG